MNSSLESLIFQFFFPVALALGVFEFFVFTKAKKSIDSFAAVFFIVAAIAALFGLAHLVVPVSGFAVVALILAAYVAAVPVNNIYGKEVQDCISAVFYLLVLVAVGAVYLPQIMFV